MLEDDVALEYDALLMLDFEWFLGPAQEAGFRRSLGSDGIARPDSGR